MLKSITNKLYKVISTLYIYNSYLANIKVYIIKKKPSIKLGFLIRLTYWKEKPFKLSEFADNTRSKLEV